MLLSLDDTMDSNEHPSLFLARLLEAAPCLTPIFRSFLVEAASVCFDEQGHQNGVGLKVEGHFVRAYALFWEPVGEAARRSHGDAEVATEYGAYGLAILLIKALTGMTVVQRSFKGTGFDFWLGDANDPGFQRKARLEVSGIRHGSTAQVKARLELKKRQIGNTPHALPGYVAVVEFGQPLTLIVRL